jgi:hypothetical protein
VSGPVTTNTQTVTSTTTVTNSSVPGWAYGGMAALLVAGLAVGYVIKRPPTSKP